jgi:hypothetical protein
LKLLSTFISKLLVQQCFGQNTCYPGAFGIPAILMLVAVGRFSTFVYQNIFLIFIPASFLIGSRWYKKPPPKTNIFNEVVAAIAVKLKYF